jgi:hypothetical protein
LGRASGIKLGFLDGMLSWRLNRFVVCWLEGTEAHERGGSGRPLTICIDNDHGAIVDELLGLASEALEQSQHLTAEGM